MDIVLTIEGMACGACKASVERLLTAHPDIHHVQVDLDSGRATLVADANIALQPLIEAVNEAGFEARIAG